MMLGSFVFTVSFLVTQQFFGSNFEQETRDSFPLTIHKVYVPVGFDNNEVSQIIIDVEYKNSCEEFGRASVFPSEDNHEVLFLRAEAFRRQTNCLPNLNIKPKVVDVGRLPISKGYQIVDFRNLDTSYGKLRVRQAGTSRIDENNYAPVSRLEVVEEPNGLRRSIILSGTFMNTCMFFSTVNVGKTAEGFIEVLPIVDLADSPSCEKRPVVFHQPVDIPQREGEYRVNTGRYVFYVRTMNGGSLVQDDYLVYE